MPSDKPRPFTEPDWNATDPEFRAWVDSMPDKYWAKYDLGACRLGWHAARSHVAPTADDSPFGPGVEEAIAKGDYASAYGRQVDQDARDFQRAIAGPQEPLTGETPRTNALKARADHSYWPMWAEEYAKLERELAQARRIAETRLRVIFDSFREEAEGRGAQVSTQPSMDDLMRRNQELERQLVNARDEWKKYMNLSCQQAGDLERLSASSSIGAPYIKVMAEQIAEIAVSISEYDRPRANRLHAIASDVMKLAPVSAIKPLTAGELNVLIDYHDNSDAEADAMDMPESADYHSKRSKHYTALRDALVQARADDGAENP